MLSNDNKRVPCFLPPHQYVSLPSSHSLQIHAAATEAEMFLFHMQSYNLLEQTMYRSSKSGSPEGAGAPWSLAPESITELLHDCFAPFERLEHAVDSRWARRGTAGGNDKRGRMIIIL